MNKVVSECSVRCLRHFSDPDWVVIRIRIIYGNREIATMLQDAVKRIAVGNCMRCVIDHTETYGAIDTLPRRITRVISETVVARKPRAWLVNKKFLTKPVKLGRK